MTNFKDIGTTYVTMVLLTGEALTEEILELTEVIILLLDNQYQTVRMALLDTALLLTVSRLV